MTCPCFPLSALPPAPQVLQEMLDMLRDHSNNHHQEKLEMIVIWLLIVGVLVALLELASLFHLIPYQT